MPHRVGGGVTPAITGSPEAVAHLRFPQNVACGFPALRSSAVDSQYSDSLQRPVGQMQLWSHQWKPPLDLVERFPRHTACAAPAAQHLAPVSLNAPMHLQQCPEVPGNAVVGIVASFMPVGFTPHRPVQVAGFGLFGCLAPMRRLVSASCSSGQRFASGFLRIRGRPRHPCLWLALPLAGRAKDFHLQVRAPCRAHQTKKPHMRLFHI